MLAIDYQQIAIWIARCAPAAQLRSDSRQVGPGDVFFACPGHASDGRAWIGAAIAQGAAAVVFDSNDFIWDPTWTVAHLGVPNLKQHAGPIAHAVHGAPDAQMFCVGVTGTNGKTSCAVWLGQALARLGAPTAVIGTLGVALFADRTHGQFSQTGNTTPDALLLAETLARMKDVGATGVAIEVSSIGLDQGRVCGMHFDVALLTNVSRDHLDYHGDMAGYEAAKLKLFEWPGLKTAVLNLDDPAGQRMLEQLRARTDGAPALVAYTLQARAVQPDIDGVSILRASALRSRHAGTEFQVETLVGSASVKTQLVGSFNVSNALAVLAALLAKGVALRAAVDAIEALTPAPGRMQQVGGKDAPLVVVDYAHTPDALEKTLDALRPIAAERGGQLWCVFGCGGDRDPGKRAQMGAVAQRADHVLVTSDNPRSEAAHAIIEAILAGMNQLGTSAQVQAIDDRAAAILSAVKHAARTDVILLAGKGHETYQEIKGKKIPFSDLEHAALALAARATMMRTN